MSDEFKKPKSLDDLEQKLYSPKQKIIPRDRSHLHEKEYGISRDWENAPHIDLQNTSLSVDTPKKNWFLRFFVVAFIFFIVALGYVGYKFYFDTGVDTKNVDILINAPLTIGAGETFTFDALVQNKNQMNLQTTDIEIIFPEGTRSASDISQNLPSTKDSLGPVETGQTAKKNYSAILFGEENEKKEIMLKVSYRVEDSNLVLEKEKKFEVVLKSTPVRLTITNVKELTSGQNLAFTVEVVSNSTQALDNVIVQATYPFGFQYKNATLAPKDDKKTWIIPKLEPKEIIKFTVNGTLEGQNNEERFFSFIAGLEDKNTGNPQVVFTKVGSTVGLERPFLELDFAINNNNSDIITLNPDTVYDAGISFKNNASYALRNVSINLQFEGQTLNKDSVQVSEGFYQSLTNVITWDNTTSDRLINIPIGRSDSVAFNFSGFSSLLGGIVVNPEVNLNISVKGNRNPDNAASDVIENSIVKKIRFNTQPTLKTRSEYYTNIFTNTGPIPPKVEQKTTYTAVLELLNTSNKLNNSIVTMQIPNYVTYEGSFLPTTEDLSYDSKTRILVWKPGTINEKTGYGTPARKISFQVSIIPSVSQVGNVPNLVSNIMLSGVDAYTGVEIKKTASSISTASEDSKGFYDGTISR